MVGQDLLCENARKCHPKRHIVVALSDVRARAAVGSVVTHWLRLQQSEASSAPRVPPLTCGQHNRAVEVYCVQDALPVCILCTATDHHGHRCLSLEDACKQQADIVRGDLGAARAKASALLVAVRPAARARS